ncbi:hypothetical protein QCA50_009530 [Cerrena zonata]|uniref:Uncharacterized protein n=1 Tax=Cerrena zonata TaxID=2478898 RepID=A0AAW0G0P1_9APHY
MRSHNSTFQAAESDRSCLANSREEEFRRTLDAFDSQFVSNKEVFSDRFREREFSRDEAENHRMQMFDSVQTMHDTQFDQRLSRYTRQLKAIIDAEVDAATSLERTVAHLLSTMDEKVQKVRRRHMLAFYKLVSPAYRDVIVAEPEDGPPTTPSGSALVGSSPNSNRDDRYREYPVDWHDTERCRPAWRTVTRRKRRHKSPSRRTDLEPESSFIPGTLMQLNSIGNTLHIPTTNELEERVSTRHDGDSRDGQIHHSSATQDFLDSELNQQQKIFLSGTRRRGVEVEQAMQKWQQVYAVNELKRQERFRAQQYSNSEAFISMEQKHSAEFDEAQRERARKFGTNEALRETLFIQEEKRRSTLFKERQERRESRFSLLLGDLLVTARKHELGREENSSGWELSIQTKFEDKIDQWKQQFISDEVKRKEQALSLEGEGSLISKLTSYLLTTNLGFVVLSVFVESIIYLTKQYK